MARSINFSVVLTSFLTVLFKTSEILSKPLLLNRVNPSTRASLPFASCWFASFNWLLAFARDSLPLSIATIPSVNCFDPSKALCEPSLSAATPAV